MSKIVVTGGCGFIGSHIVQTLSEQHAEIIVIDNLLTGFRQNIAPFITDKKVTLVIGDIHDRALLDKTFKNATTVFHLAARISVPESVSQPIEYVTTNDLGTLNVLEASRHAGVKSLVFASSAAVYGNQLASPALETMPTHPDSVYALTKVDGEYFCRLYRENYGIHTTALRFFNVYGSRQNPKSPYAAAVPIFIEKALRNEDILIYGDGTQTRDFIHVKDVARACLLAAEYTGGVFNVASGNSMTINELARKIIFFTRSKSKIVFQAERPGDIKHSAANIQKITQELGFKPKYDLVQGLNETIPAFELSLS